MACAEPGVYQWSTPPAQKQRSHACGTQICLNHTSNLALYFRLPQLLVCACECLCPCGCMHRSLSGLQCAHAHEGQRSEQGMFLSLSVWWFKDRVCHSSEFTSSVRLTGQQAPRTLLFPIHQNWKYKGTQPCPIFFT